MSCRIIAGERGAGKTTAMLRLFRREGGEGVVSIHDGDCYRLLFLPGMEERLLMSSEPLFPGRIGRWFYDGDAFAEALRRLMSAASSPVLIDEAGALELDGGGFAPAIEALSSAGRDIVLSVRHCYVEPIIRTFHLASASVIEAADYP